MKQLYGIIYHVIFTDTPLLEDLQWQATMQHAWSCKHNHRTWTVNVWALERLHKIRHNHNIRHNILQKQQKRYLTCTANAEAMIWQNEYTLNLAATFYDDVYGHYKSTSHFKITHKKENRRVRDIQKCLFSCMSYIHPFFLFLSAFLRMFTMVDTNGGWLAQTVNTLHFTVNNTHHSDVWIDMRLINKPWYAGIQTCCAGQMCSWSSDLSTW